MPITDYQIISQPSGRVWNFDTKEARDQFVEENNLPSTRINLNPIEVTAKAVTPAAKVTATQSAFRANPTPENAYRYHDALAMANHANPYNATKLLLGYNAAIPVVAGLGMGLASAGEAVAPLIAPYKPAIDATFGAIGAQNLVSDNGVRKTINLFSNGDYSNGAVSLLGDALDITAMYPVVNNVRQVTNQITNAVRSYKNATRNLQDIANKYYSGLQTNQVTPNIQELKVNVPPEYSGVVNQQLLEKTLNEVIHEPSFMINYIINKLPPEIAVRNTIFDNLGKYGIRTQHPEVYDFHTKYLVPRFQAFGVQNPNISDIKIYNTKTPGVLLSTGTQGLFNEPTRTALLDPTATPTTPIHEVASHGTDIYVPSSIQNQYQMAANALTQYGATEPGSRHWWEIRALKNELMAIDLNMGNFQNVTPEVIEKFKKGLEQLNSTYSDDYLNNLSRDPSLHNVFKIVWPYPVVAGAAALPQEEENY